MTVNAKLQVKNRIKNRITGALISPILLSNFVVFGNRFHLMLHNLTEKDEAERILYAMDA
jgi:hypothetical protein